MSGRSVGRLAVGVKARDPRDIGYCIYCGDDQSLLSREHVVPYALGGTAVLQHASCGACASITKKFEQFCARTMFGDLRVKYGFPTRHPADRPNTLKVTHLDRRGVREEIDVQPGDHPAPLLLPILPDPSILMEPDAQRRDTFRMWLGLPNTEVLALSDRSGKSLRLGAFEISNFYRLLAKIAHAGAYYFCPDWSSGCVPLLKGLILGSADDYHTLIGGDDETPCKGEKMAFPAQLRLVDHGERTFLVVEFRLFGEDPTPLYRIVVGQMRPVSAPD